MSKGCCPCKLLAPPCPARFDDLQDCAALAMPSCHLWPPGKYAASFGGAMLVSESTTQRISQFRNSRSSSPCATQNIHTAGAWTPVRHASAWHVLVIMNKMCCIGWKLRVPSTCCSQARCLNAGADLCSFRQVLRKGCQCVPDEAGMGHHSNAALRPVHPKVKLMWTLTPNT